MSEPFIKTRPGTGEDSGKLCVVMDSVGHEYFMRMVNRAQPTRQDNPKAFTSIKDRIQGAFLAGAVVMGWQGR